MTKPEDLMVDNWIRIADEGYNSMRGEYHQIDWIKRGEIGLDNRKIITPPYADPVPLTREILENNEWKYAKSPTGDQMMVLHNDKGVAFLWWMLDTKDMMLTGGSLIHVPYVHQMQNILKFIDPTKKIIL